MLRGGEGTTRRGRTALALALLATTAAFGDCRSGARQQARVAATVFPVYDLARRVAGDRFDVRLVLAPGLDPHGYEPRPKDVAALADLTLLFAVGLGLDPWAGGVARAAGAGEGRVFELGPLMDPILTPPGLVRGQPIMDPHFWTDPLRARHAVDVVVEALGGLDPEGGPFYRERGAALQHAIDGVHEEVRGHSAQWRRRRIVTFHGSLFYFAARYGLQVVGVVQPVPGSEPTGQHVSALGALLRPPDGAALFVEPQLDAQLARALARDAGVPVHPVDPLGGGPAAPSYEELIRGITRAMDGALR